MKNFLNKQRGLTLIELMMVVTMIGLIMTIAIPAYRDYMTSAKWGKALTYTRSLQIAVDFCLVENAFKFDMCDSLDANKQIVAQGITAYQSATDDFSSIDLVPTTAAIKIAGKAPLLDCILNMVPSHQGNLIVWSYTMSSGSSAADAGRCTRYIKHSTAV